MHIEDTVPLPRARLSQDGLSFSQDGHPRSQDTPSQDAPSQDTPSQDTPSQDGPSQEAVSRDALLREPATADLSGRCVGNSYVLISPAGSGSSGVVWRALERSSGAHVAVKLLHESLLRQPKLVARFVRERAILAMVRHEHIVGVRDLFSVGESLALVMDFVGGGSLRDRLATDGTLATTEAARLCAQVCAALTQAHELGVVHRDVKPDNILLDPGTGVRLTDFGLARINDGEGLTTPQAIMGTPHYMAPETAMGEAGTAADVYSLGIVLYELVAGRPPFSGEPLAVLRRHVEEEPGRPDGMTDDVWDLLRWCLAKDPRRRPAAAELGLALGDLARRASGRPALEVISPLPVRREPARRRPRNGPRSWKWQRGPAL